MRATVLERVHDAIATAKEHDRASPEPGLYDPSNGHGLGIFDRVPMIGMQPRCPGLLPPTARRSKGRNRSLRLRRTHYRFTLRRDRRTTGEKGAGAPGVI